MTASSPIGGCAAAAGSAAGSCLDARDLLAVAALAVLPAWCRRMHADIGEWWALGPAFLGSALLFAALDLCKASGDS